MIASIVWTTEMFYGAMAILHVVFILAGYRLLQVDPENNTFIGAIVASLVINGVAYFVRDMGILSVMAQIAVSFGMLVAIASGEAIKAGIVGFFVLASYGVVGNYVVKNSDLSQTDLGGFSLVVAQGGLEAEPMTEANAAGDFGDPADEYEYEELEYEVE